MSGLTANVSDFMNPSVLDGLANNILTIQAVMSETNATDLPLWIGETASCYGGGAKNLSDRYVSGFL